MKPLTGLFLIKAGGIVMNEVKIYDKSGSLKKIISSKELKKRADMLITNPMQYRKTNRKPSSLKPT